MGILIRLLSVGVALVSSTIILRSLRQQRLTLGFSTVWITLALVVVVLGCGGDAALDPIARFVGVGYPPTLLFLAAIIVLLLLTAHLSVKVALLDKRLRDVIDRYGREHAVEPALAADITGTDVRSTEAD